MIRDAATSIAPTAAAAKARRLDGRRRRHQCRVLVDLAAARAAQTAPVINSLIAAYNDFVTGFPFTERLTRPGHRRGARDLASGKPMDRLAVGDVGFGKTEVALRAAATYSACRLRRCDCCADHASSASTRNILQPFEAYRHHRRLRSPASPTPPSARTPAPASPMVAISIVIGTAAVASKAVTYAKLALVVIDEEQRFGAADKAKLRSLAADLHQLALTATPIRRRCNWRWSLAVTVSIIAAPASPLRTIPHRHIVFDLAPSERH